MRHVAGNAVDIAISKIETLRWSQQIVQCTHLADVVGLFKSSGLAERLLDQ